MIRIDISETKRINDAPLVATVGFFDGVHIGHQHLIEQVKAEAQRLGLPAAVITFPVHPRKVLQADYQPMLLNGYEEKMERLSATGIDYGISLPFTRELSQLTAQEFMHTVLKNDIGVHTLLVGHDHRFGRNRENDFSAYKRFGNEVGLRVMAATELQENGENISSSKIRNLLKNGDIRKANAFLSYHYTMSGKIIEGYQVGRTIGFPTANIRAWEPYKVIPQLGVYAVLVHIQNVVYQGMLYIGRRPTLNHDSETSIEVNIFDFDENLYNQSIAIEFVDFIRGDIKFDTLEQLKEQIHRDKDKVMAILKR